jgi:hypothetical protein
MLNICQQMKNLTQPQGILRIGVRSEKRERSFGNLTGEEWVNTLFCNAQQA